jgi:dienelactone hydrolase
MPTTDLRQHISTFLNFQVPDTPVSFTTNAIIRKRAYTMSRIQFAGDEGDQIPAFLITPPGEGPFPAVLVHHQHHSQRHIGKSEVCGLAGDRWQAFGPALARRGVAVLAPDSICFEDRRRGVRGTEPHANDVSQHYDEMCYRLLRGDTLMRKVLSDSAQAISLLREHPLIDPGRIGILGHSYGGNTVLFHAALDARIRFACASGAACSYQYKMAHQIGIEMAEVIPGFADRFDIHDLVGCMAPRPVLIVSATEDVFSQDADQIVQRAKAAYAATGREAQLEHVRYPGGHALDAERFERIVGWMTNATGDR